MSHEPKVKKIIVKQAYINYLKPPRLELLIACFCLQLDSNFILFRSKVKQTSVTQNRKDFGAKEKFDDAPNFIFKRFP